MSIAELSDSDNVTVFDKDHVKLYDGKTAKFRITEKAILEGCWCK